jgi:CPA1 family monovalent cation:H+ antiporter
MAVSIELMIAGFLLVVVVTALISMRLKIPYTVILVLFGVFTTAALTLFSLNAGPFQEHAQALISEIQSAYNTLAAGGSSSLFVGLILPPLLFEAMIHIRSQDLKSVIRPALALATIGVVIATIVCGLVLWLWFGLSIYVSFLFAALIAPADMVTVLEVFRRVKVPSKLATLLQTESAFNDAPAIVIFTIILSAASLQIVTPMDAFVSFGFILGVGALIGLIVAFIGEVLSSLFVDRVVETILAVVVVYGSYALAQGVGASGLVAVAVAGLYYGSYTMRTALDESEREAVKTFWQVVAFISNTVAFLLIGFQANLLTLPQSIVLILAAFIAVTLGRAATVYPILSIFKKNLCKKTSRQWGNVALLGGVRGAVSIVLASAITATAEVSEGDVSLINTMVFGVAFISIMIQVPLLMKYVQRAMSGSQTALTSELNMHFENIQTAIAEVNLLKAENKISPEEYDIRIDEIKNELDEIICKSSACISTKKIIQERATTVFATLPKLSPLHTIADSNKSWWHRKKKIKIQ